MGAAVVAFLAVLTFKETYREPLEGAVIDPQASKATKPLRDAYVGSWAAPATR
jgi:hypothetical protein